MRYCHKITYFVFVVSRNVILLHIKNTKNNIFRKWTFLPKSRYKRKLHSAINYNTVPVLPLSHCHDSVEFFYYTKRAADNCVFGL